MSVFSCFCGVFSAFTKRRVSDNKHVMPLEQAPSHHCSEKALPFTSSVEPTAFQLGKVAQEELTIYVPLLLLNGLNSEAETVSPMEKHNTSEANQTHFRTFVTIEVVNSTQQVIWGPGSIALSSRISIVRRQVAANIGSEPSSVQLSFDGQLLPPMQTLQAAGVADGSRLRVSNLRTTRIGRAQEFLVEEFDYRSMQDWCACAQRRRRLQQKLLELQHLRLCGEVGPRVPFTTQFAANRHKAHKLGDFEYNRAQKEYATHGTSICKGLRSSHFQRRTPIF